MFEDAKGDIRSCISKNRMAKNTRNGQLNATQKKCKAKKIRVLRKGLSLVEYIVPKKTSTQKLQILNTAFNLKTRTTEAHCLIFSFALNVAEQNRFKL